jgi:hypothetical protein
MGFRHFHCRISLSRVSEQLRHVLRQAISALFGRNGPWSLIAGGMVHIQLKRPEVILDGGFILAQCSKSIRCRRIRWRRQCILYPYLVVYQKVRLICSRCP